MPAAELAAACVLVRAAPAEDRHNYLVLITGFLVRALGHDGAAAILAPVARLVLAKRYNKPDGHRLLDDTARKIEAGDPVPGWPKLVETIGERRAARVAAWLGVERREKTSPVEWPDPAALPGGLPPVKAFDMMHAARSAAAMGRGHRRADAGPRRLPGRRGYDLWRARRRPEGRDPAQGARRLDRDPEPVGRDRRAAGPDEDPSLAGGMPPAGRLEIAAKKEHEQALAEYEARQRIAKQKKKIDDEKIAKDLKAKRDPKGIAAQICSRTAEDEPPPHRRALRRQRQHGREAGRDPGRQSRTAC